jgi:DNA (cytosine-5)-methyltransferase 1
LTFKLWWIVKTGMISGRPIGVDLFAGVGGMTLGFEQAGFDVLAAVEIDPIHCATHQFNFPFCSVLCKSVIDTISTEIRSRSAIGDRDIDVVFGGSPCQGFSLIGKRALDDPRNALVHHFLRLVLELKPKYFVFENVPGLTIGNHRQFLSELIAAFGAGGYEVKTDYRVLNAANYGVPQDRARLFLLGCRSGLPLPEYPQPVTKPAIARKSKYILDLPNLAPTPTIEDALCDLPIIEMYPELFRQDWAIAKYGKPSSYSSKMRGIFSSQDNYSGDRYFDSRLLTASLRTRHGNDSIARFAATKCGEVEPISHFYKLAPEGICNTLRAGTASNLGAFTSPRPIHPYQPRCITVREAARLHSYPDWFRFHRTKWHGFRQVGNSVPPLLAQAIAREIMRVLEINPVKPKETKLLGSDSLLQLNMTQAAQIYGVAANAIAPRLKQKGRE